MSLTTPDLMLIEYIAFQVYSAFIQSLPNPSEYGGVWYKAVYNFLSILAADFKSFVPVPPVVKTQATVSTEVSTSVVTK